MTKVKSELLKPLDGNDIGSVVEFSQADFDRLEKLGAVKAAPEPQPATKAEKAEAAKAKKG